MLLNRFIPYKMFNPRTLECLSWDASSLQLDLLCSDVVMSSLLSAHTVGMPRCPGNCSPSWGPFPGCLHAFSAQNPGWGTYQGEVPSRLKCPEAHSDHLQVRGSPGDSSVMHQKQCWKCGRRLDHLGSPVPSPELCLLNSVITSAGWPLGVCWQFCALGFLSLDTSTQWTMLGSSPVWLFPGFLPWPAWPTRRESSPWRTCGLCPSTSLLMWTAEGRRLWSTPVSHVLDA